MKKPSAPWPRRRARGTRASRRARPFLRARSTATGDAWSPARPAPPSAAAARARDAASANGARPASNHSRRPRPRARASRRAPRRTAAPSRLRRRGVRARPSSLSSSTCSTASGCPPRRAAAAAPSPSGARATIKYLMREGAMFSDSENPRARARDRGKRGAVRERDRAALDVLAAHVGEPRDRVELEMTARRTPSASARAAARAGSRRSRPDVERVHAHCPRAAPPRARPDRVDRSAWPPRPAARAEAERGSRGPLSSAAPSSSANDAETTCASKPTRPAPASVTVAFGPASQSSSFGTLRLRAPHQRPLRPELLLRPALPRDNIKNARSRSATRRPSSENRERARIHARVSAPAQLEEEAPVGPEQRGGRARTTAVPAEPVKPLTTSRRRKCATYSERCGSSLGTTSASIASASKRAQRREHDASPRGRAGAGRRRAGRARWKAQRARGPARRRGQGACVRRAERAALPNVIGGKAGVGSVRGNHSGRFWRFHST